MDKLNWMRNSNEKYSTKLFDWNVFDWIWNNNRRRNFTINYVQCRICHNSPKSPWPIANGRSLLYARSTHTRCVWLVILFINTVSEKKTTNIQILFVARRLRRHLHRSPMSTFLFEEKKRLCFLLTLLIDVSWLQLAVCSARRTYLYEHKLKSFIAYNRFIYNT